MGAAELYREFLPMLDHPSGDPIKEVPVRRDGRVWSFCPIHGDGSKHGRRSMSLHTDPVGRRASDGSRNCRAHLPSSLATIVFHVSKCSGGIAGDGPCFQTPRRRSGTPWAVSTTTSPTTPNAASTPTETGH